MADLEAVEHLRSPEYWNGIDINNLDLSERGEPATEILSQETLQYAGGMLLNAVRDIARGEYAETTVPLAQNDGAPLKQYPEGTVIVMDREYLLRQSNYNDKYPVWAAEDRFNRSAEPIREPFVTRWLNAQEAPDSPSFGTDIMYFPEGRHLYARALLWGVLVKADYHMLISTYGFTVSGPDLEDDRISLLLNEDRGGEPDPSYSLAESVALARSQPYVRPVSQVYPIEARVLPWTNRGANGAENGEFYVEMVERTRSVQVIQTAGDPALPVLRKEYKGFLHFFDVPR